MQSKDSYGDPKRREPRNTLSLAAEKIRDPARIITILTHIEQDHTLLTVALPGSEHLYNSALLGVSRDTRALLLDELHPHIGHLQLQVVQRAVIRARYRGVEVSFTSSLTEVGTTDGVAHYRMSLPELLHYRQRRADHRVKVGNAHIVPLYTSVLARRPSTVNSGTSRPAVQASVSPSRCRTSSRKATSSPVARLS